MPRYMGGAGGVHGDATDRSVFAAAAQVGGVAQRWIDDEGPAGVIGGYVKSNERRSRIPTASGRRSK